ncbi:amino acid adenylation domain-containing protein [Streptomyces sp. SLBN-8D4]
MAASPADLVEDLEKRGVRFSLHEGRLRVFAPKDVLTGDLRQRLQDWREDIVELLGTRQGAPRGSAPSISRADRRDRLPLSFAQQRLWFLDQLEPGTAEYNVPMHLRLGRDIDVVALHAALTAVVARHEVLRTRLVADPDGVAYQVIDPPGPVPLPVVDVSGVADPLGVARDLVEGDAVAPFDLAAGPVLRACLIRLGAAGHVLAVSVHHVASDEWSGRIFHRELELLYKAFRAGEPDPLAPLAVQYADYAVWQRSWLTGEVLDGQLAYWREKLAGAPVLELPVDRPRSRVSDGPAASAGFVIPAPVADRLKEIARRNGATMFMTLLAASAVLLGRYCGQDDVVVGAPVANRSRTETDDVIGFFVNTLVLRTDLSGDPTFAELLGRVRDMALGAYEHQDLPFEQLVDALATQRERSRAPLFQVLFNYDPAAPADGMSESADGLPLDTSPPARFDLVLGLGEVHASGELVGRIDYRTSLFDAATVERMAAHLVNLLTVVAEDAEQRIGDLPLLSVAERARLLVGWNGSVVAVAGVGGVHGLVGEWVERCPDAVAVVCGSRQVTYGGLWERAGRVAGLLRAGGVGAESVVGLCLERGLDMVVAVLGVWRAGAAYVPLDPGYPVERLALMLAGSGARVLVGHRGVAGGLVDGSGVESVVWLDEAVLPSALPALEPVVVDSGGLAYVMFTSGSTGVPKGVQVTHGGAVNLAVAQRGLFGLGEGDRVLGFASFSFDASVWELLMALSVGASLVVASARERVEPGRVAALVRSWGVGVATVPPSLLQALEGGDPAQLAGVRTLVTAGERLDEELAGVWAVGRRLFNAYGPTETTVCASAGLYAAGGGVPSIGGPVANTRVYVLDRSLGLVPTGVGRGVVCRRDAGGTRLCGASRADRGAFRPRPVYGGWCAGVSDRGPGAVAFGWPAGVFGPGG